MCPTTIFKEEKKRGGRIFVVLSGLWGPFVLILCKNLFLYVAISATFSPPIFLWKLTFQDTEDKEKRGKNLLCRCDSISRMLSRIPHRVWRGEAALFNGLEERTPSQFHSVILTISKCKAIYSRGKMSTLP